MLRHFLSTPNDGPPLTPSRLTPVFTNISNIPMTDMDHIDVICDGVADSYGADGAGGIVNFALHGAPLAADSEEFGRSAGERRLHAAENYNRGTL
jgi:outer membrane cobalamin receptor